MDASTKYLYHLTDESELMTLDLLGGKGYHLSRMAKEGIKVPPAMILTTELCRKYMQSPEEVMAYVRDTAVTAIINQLVSEFGYMPLVSVRSGAKVSMPGMMDTILNVGIDKETYAFWQDKLGEKCAMDSYKRLITMYGDVVNGIDRKRLEAGTFEDTYQVWATAVGATSWLTTRDQLVNAIEAVFRSWNNERAKVYRKLNNIPDDIGTAVVVQAMVFGNMGEKSCTGVLFSRNPSNGDNEITGEFLVNAQGEDVVAGIRTPQSLNHLPEWNKAVADELMLTVEKLEALNRDMQDIEFTVQEGELFILQTRNGKRTAQAAVRIAVDLYNEGMVTREEMFKKLTLKQFLTAIRPVISPAFKQPEHGKGLPASNGIVSGLAVFSAKDAVNCSEPCILIAEETTPDDIAGMNAAMGILTSTGGITSHAAVVARGMDKVCVVGCEGLHIGANGTATLSDGNAKVSFKSGDMITLDGGTGRIWVGLEVPVVDGKNMPEVATLINHAHTHLNTLPIKTELSDWMPKSFLFPTYQFDKSNTAPAEMTDIFKQVLHHMDSGVIDLRSRVELADNPIMALMANDAGQDELAFKLIALALAVPEGSVKEGVQLYLGSNLPDGVKFPLAEKGFTVIPTVASLEDLIMAENGMVAYHIQNGITGAVADKVMKLKQASGESLTAFQIGHMKGDVADGVFAMGDMPAIQQVLS